MTTPAPAGALLSASAPRTALVTATQNEIKISAFKTCPDQPALSISKTTLPGQGHCQLRMTSPASEVSLPVPLHPTSILPLPWEESCQNLSQIKSPPTLYRNSPGSQLPQRKSPHTSRTSALPPPPLTCSSCSGLGLFVFLQTKNACCSTECLVCVILLREKHAGCGFLKTHYTYLQRLFGSFSDECC